uniref:Uncharacterized protein n=1 Tax=Anguilla anguilla TaxID=7936 RepID=A0A0E9T2Q2_ANGAN
MTYTVKSFSFTHNFQTIRNKYLLFTNNHLNLRFIKMATLCCNNC